MPYRVYRLKASDRPRLDQALTDDILSRQSLTVRDARHFNLAGDWLYLFVEGTDAGMARADAVVLEFAERAPEAPTLYALLQQEEDAAASGLGSVFGDF